MKPAVKWISAAAAAAICVCLCAVILLRPRGETGLSVGDDYLYAVSQCRNFVDEGSDSNFVALIYARRMLEVVEGYEREFASELPGGQYSSLLSAYLSAKLESAAQAWGTAAAVQDTLGEKETAAALRELSGHLRGQQAVSPDTVDYRAVGAYAVTRQRGIRLLDDRDYGRAETYFSAAGAAPDCPAENDVSRLIGICHRRAEEARRSAERTDGSVPEQTSAAGTAAPEQKTPEPSEVREAGFEITGILFANAASKGKMIGEFGAPLRASEVCYLKPKVLYRSIRPERMSVYLSWRLIGPDGTVIRSRKSPEGFTSAGRFSILPGEGRELLLPGWGIKYPGFYSAGIYRYEIWFGEDLLYMAEFVMM